VTDEKRAEVHANKSEMVDGIKDLKDSYTPAQQTVAVRESPSWMERGVEIEITTHTNDKLTESTKIFLTEDEAAELRYAIDAFLNWS